MDRQLQTTRTNENTWLWLGAGLLGLGVVGAVVVTRSRSKSKSSTDSGTSGSKAPVKSLGELAAELRVQLLTVNGCAVSWRLGEASRTALRSHVDDFFKPAIADASSRSLSSIDEVTAHVAGLLVPGCPWPPTLIDDFDIEAAVAGKLPLIQSQMWTIAQSTGSVQLYLEIRQVVAALRANRRG